MNDLDLLFRGMNVDSESKENDEDLIADVSRLVSIIEMLLSEMGDFILEVHVSPMNILQTKLEDIKHLKFHILYNWTLGIDEVHAKKQECTELFESLLIGEFDSIQNFDELDFQPKPVWTVPTIQLYSAFKEFNFEQEIADDNVYLWLYDFVKDGDFTISLPYSFGFVTCKSILIHCKIADGIVRLCKIKPEDGPKGMFHLKEFEDGKTYFNQVVYVPMVGLKRLQYELPYYYVDRDSFNWERLSKLLPQEEQD